MNIFDIDWVYVNLDCRPDRKAHVESQLARHGISARRQPGQLVTKENHEPGHEDKQMYNRTPGAIGCWNSQVKAMKSSPVGSVTAVLEDDVCLCDDFPERIEYIGEHCPDDWDVFWLGGTVHMNPAIWHKNDLGRDAERVGRRIFRAYGMWSTFAYLVNPTSRDRVLDLLECNKYRSDGIDDCFIKWVEPNIKSYFLVPGSCWQYDNQSNIGNGITEFSGFRKLGPYVWQSRMSQFDPDTFNFGEAG